MEGGMKGSKACECHEIAGMCTDLSSRDKRKSRKIFTTGLCGHEEFLID